ncbi:haloalkane dehalogenase [Dactylosporangium sp. McL0621]|uniref:haloalkane dehalogenase n=1 Tax=Dactylosporangium sp. McL0621 TaxID=3415678 RepID=UPI003CFB40C4
MKVLGTTMHCLDTGGDGPPVLFLHGNPTSSQLWSGVLEHADLGGRRAVAPDLIGMGRSGRPDLEYRLADHVEHVDALLDALGLERPVLVGHDWGVAIGMELLRRRPQEIRGFAFMEGHLRPLAGWEEFDEGGREVFRRLRTRGEGERMVLDENFFIEAVAPQYGEHYPDARSRRPLLQWAREIPIAGEPADTVALMAAGWAHLRESPVPKLLVHGSPGVVVTAERVALCRAELPALTVAGVGDAGHFLPADAPEAVARALGDWLRTFDE